VALETLLPQIRLATVVDEFSAAASCGAIDDPIPVQFEEIRPSIGFPEPNRGEALSCRPPTDSLSRVLDYFSMRRDGLFGEDAEAMDGRAANPKLEAGIP
jgi:hypothetical protein